MASTTVGPTSGKQLSDLLKLLEPKKLDSVYIEFMELTNAPPDLKCLLIVAANLHHAFKKLRAWRQIGPFKGWPRLMLFLCIHAREIEQQFGEIVKPPVPAAGVLGTPWLKENFEGEIELRPFYVMLCCKRTDFEIRYGALQLQMLYARWAESRAVRAVNASPIQLPSGPSNPSSGTRLERLPQPYARAVRDLSGPHFTGLLAYLRPEQHPDAFVGAPGVGTFPLRANYPDRFNRIMRYCRLHGGARQWRSHAGASQEPRQAPYPEYVGYTDFRFALKIEDEGEDGRDRIEQQAILDRPISEERALELGLDPQEVGQGSVDVLNEVPGAGSADEALQTARARTRSWEIDKSLFGWSAQALRIAELKTDLFPALHHARDDKDISSEDLAAAAVVAVAIDTGRDLDRILKLKVEQLADTEFAFEPPTQHDPSGWWFWRTIGPLYKSELKVPPEMSEDRADHLRFTVAPLVRDLIVKHLKRHRIRSGDVFRDEMTGDWVKAWIKEKDPEQRITLNRLSHLRWNELHRITGGERAIACLVLGVPRTPVAVELHYAVLGSREAARRFEESSRGIWGEECAASNGQAGESDRDAYAGCRAFPTRAAVKETVGWLRNGSRHFFGIELKHFSASKHRQFLNRAVLYLLWHQFHAFGTRAINDAYQTKDEFTQNKGLAIGILSDKDFASRYKTRVILADPSLLGHMRAVEKRLARIAKKLRLVSKVKKSSVWFLNPDSQPVVPITTTDISTVFGDKFAFPVNTPRKVMRNLLRERHVSHEHAETYMGHWSHGREPWSPYSSFDFGEFVAAMQKAIPGCLRDLGFTWFPTEDAR